LPILCLPAFCRHSLCIVISNSSKIIIVVPVLCSRREKRKEKGKRITAAGRRLSSLLPHTTYCLGSRDHTLPLPSCRHRKWGDRSYYVVPSQRGGRADLADNS
jgi:hypothetical protein